MVVLALTSVGCDSSSGEAGTQAVTVQFAAKVGGGVVWAWVIFRDRL